MPNLQTQKRERLQHYTCSRIDYSLYTHVQVVFVLLVVVQKIFIFLMLHCTIQGSRHIFTDIMNECNGTMYSRYRVVEATVCVKKEQCHVT